MKVFLSYSTNSRFNKEREMFAEFLAENNHTLVTADLTDTALPIFENGKVKLIAPSVKSTSFTLNSDSLLSCFDKSDLMVFFPGGLNTIWMLSSVLHHAYYAKINKPIIIVNLDGFFDNFINTIKVSFHEASKLSTNVSWYYVVNDLLSAYALINQVSILKPLSSVVHIGDYVDYPVKYENVTLPNGQKSELNGWRVLSVEQNHVLLISAGTPLTATFTKEESAKILINELKDFIDFKYDKNDFANALITATFNKYTLYPCIFTYDNINLASDDSLYYNGTDVYIYSLESGKILLLRNDKTFDDKPFGTYGVRIVVTLSKNILTSGKNNNNVWSISL